MFNKSREIKRLKNELSSIAAERDELSAKYKVVSQDYIQVESFGHIISCKNQAIMIHSSILRGYCEQNNMLVLKNRELEEELSKYKQKYADELQKRLDLIATLEKE